MHLTVFNYLANGLQYLGLELVLSHYRVERVSQLVGYTCIYHGEQEVLIFLLVIQYLLGNVNKLQNILFSLAYLYTFNLNFEELNTIVY